jgi:hypothetical protein
MKRFVLCELQNLRLAWVIDLHAIESGVLGGGRRGKGRPGAPGKGRWFCSTISQIHQPLRAREVQNVVRVHKLVAR